MNEETADHFTALLLIFLCRNEPELAARGLWFWPFEDEGLEAHRN